MEMTLCLRAFWSCSKFPSVALCTCQLLTIKSMQFYFDLILIHRPLLQMPNAQKAIANAHGGSIDSATVCTLAATNMAKLVRDYQQFYSLRRVSSPVVHFTFIAATIHIVNFRLTQEKRHEFWLNGCLAALVEMSESYPIARRARCVLEQLLKRWKPQEESPRQQRSAAYSMDDRANARATAPEADMRGITTIDQETLDASGVHCRFVWPISSDSDVLTVSRTASRSHSELRGSMPDFERGFDWSEYPSPIELPPIFDASMVPLSELDFPGVESGSPANLAAMPSFSQYQPFNDHSGFSLATNNGLPGLYLDESTLSSLYGSSFALMN